MSFSVRTLILAALQCWLQLACSHASIAAAATESDLKAAYLINVLKLVHRKEPPADRGSMTLCLVAAGTLEQSMRAVEGSIIGGRKLKLLILRRDSEMRGCEAIFLGRTAGLRSTMDRARTLGLLTVGSDADFIPMSGMISLLVEGRKIVVEVNGDAIKTADWVFSSHLLEVARMTRPGTAAWNR